jgi:hypothetical protein
VGPRHMPLASHLCRHCINGLDRRFRRWARIRSSLHKTRVAGATVVAAPRPWQRSRNSHARNPNERPLREYDAMEREAVYLLTDPTRQPPIRALADMGRELETAVVAPLIRAGLVRRTSADCVLQPLRRSSGLRWWVNVV